MPSVRVGELEVAYRCAGNGPPLVLLHGGFSDGREWRRQLEGLADEMTVVAWDEPGSGGSSDPPEGFGLAEFADALAGFLKALDIGRSAHVCGLSWGGVVAQELYRRHPPLVGSLILADTYAGWKGSLPAAEVAARLELVLSVASGDDPPKDATPGLFSEHADSEVVAECDRIGADSRPRSMRRIGHEVANCDHRDLLPRINVPTLLIWGELDERSPLHVADQFRAAIPHSQLVVIPNAGHMTSMEQPEAFNDAVRTFCRANPL